MPKQTVASGQFSKIGIATVVGMSVLTYASLAWSANDRFTLKVPQTKCLEIAKDAATTAGLTNIKQDTAHNEVTGDGGKNDFIISCRASGTDSVVSIIVHGNNAAAPAAQKYVDALNKQITTLASGGGASTGSSSTSGATASTGSSSASGAIASNPTRVLVPDIIDPEKTFSPGNFVIKGHTSPNASVEVKVSYTKQATNQTQQTGLGAAVGSFFQTLLSGKPSSPSQATREQVWSGKVTANANGEFTVTVPKEKIPANLTNNTWFTINAQASLTGVSRPSGTTFKNIQLKR
ncbi:MAG TPA: hypothetical protein V6D14_08420 [Coleofasciculaceae cyanobacterium]